MANHGFPRTSRLLRPEEFRAVFNNSQYKASCRHILILACANQKGQSRLGLVVAKKHVPKAVHRNRLKRLIRNWFRLNKEFKNHLDLVVLARKDAGKLSNAQLTAKLSELRRDLESKSRSGST